MTITTDASPDQERRAAAGPIAVHPVGHDVVAVVDFGSQYSQLIARRVRECQVYCELVPWDISAADLERLNPRAFILSGSPASVYEPGAPSLQPAILERGRPIR